MRLGQAVGAHRLGQQGHDHGCLGLAGVQHVGLALEDRREGIARQVPVGAGGDLQAEFRLAFAAGDGDGLGIAAMAVEQHHALEARARGGPHDALQHGGEGVVVERDGAAEGHVMLGEAGPDAGHHHGGPAGRDHAAGDALRDAAGADDVDAGREVRAMLLERGDRDDDERIRRRAGVELREGELHPLDLGVLRHGVLRRAEPGGGWNARGQASRVARNRAASARIAATLRGSIFASVRSGMAIRGFVAKRSAWRAMKSQ